MSTTPPPPDPYLALGVSKDATLDQIRSSHRKLVLKAHPDRFPNASPEEKQKKADEFHKIQQAYEILSDDTERKKYDDNVRLAQAKANLMRERAEWDREKESARARKPAPFRSSHQYQPSGQHEYGPPPRSSTMPVHEPRNVIYEERAPRATPKRYDDDFHQPYDPSPRFEDVRSSPKFKSESFRSGSRRTSARDIFAEDPRRTEEFEEKMRNKTRKQEQKRDEMKMHREDEKARDKNRRKERESAQYERTPKLGVLSDETDSEDLAPRHSRRKGEAPSSGRREEASRRSRRDRDGKSSRRSRDEYSTDSENDRAHTRYRERQSDRERNVAEYIRLQRGSSDMDEAVRSNRHSKRNGERVSSVPPPPPMAPTVPKEKGDAAKRSSAAKKISRESRESPSRSSSRRERPIEIVEPPTSKNRRSAGDSSKSRPGLKNSESAPPEVLDQVLRSQSFPVKNSEKIREPPSVSRAKTGGLEYMQSGGNSSSRGREVERDRSPVGTPKSRRGGEYSSPMVDEVKDGGWTRYQVLNDETLSPRIVPIEPGSRSSRTRGPDSRDPSPRNSSSRRTPARSNTTARTAGLGINGLPRANTFQEKSTKDFERERLPRSQTARSGSIDIPSSSTIFGEIPPGASARDAVPPRPIPNRSSGGVPPSASYTPEEISWRQPFTKDDIIFTDRPRHERTSSGMSSGGGPGGNGGGSSSRREPKVFRDRSPRDRDRDADYRDGSGSGGGSGGGSGKKDRSDRGGQPYLSRGSSNMGRHMPQVRV